MSNKTKYNFSYGYLTNTQLKNIKLPEKIKCDFCKKSMPPRAFGETQHAKVRAAIHKSGRNNARYEVLCIPCSGSGRTEFECMDCKTWKGLEHFSKQQRKTPDRATCKTCMEEHLAFEPREIDRATKPGSRSDSEGEYDTDCTEDWCDDEDEDDDVIVEDTHADDATSSTTSIAGLSIDDTTAGSIGSSRVTSSYFSSMNTAGRNAVGSVSLGGSEVTATENSYGIPRTRTAVSATSTSNSHWKFPKIPKAKRDDTDNMITVEQHDWSSDSEEDAVYDSDDQEEDDDDDDD